MHLGPYAIRVNNPEESLLSFTVPGDVIIEPVPWGAAFHVMDAKDNLMLEFFLNTEQLKRLAHPS